MKIPQLQRLTFSLILILMTMIPGLNQAQVINGKVARDHFDLHYKVYGSKGDYIVMLSGGPGSSVDYMQPFADTLSRFYRCVMLEQRGTGRSVLKKHDSTTISMDLYVADLEALRTHLKIRQFILLGNSWGSMLSLLYSSSYPDNVSKVLLIGPGILSDKHADVFDDNLHIRYLPYEKEIRDFWREKRKDPLTFVKANYERSKAGMPAYYYDRSIGLKEAAKLKITDVNYYVPPAFWQSHPTFDIRPGLSNITAEVLLVQGRQDPCGDENSIETQQHIKKCKLAFIERCGHSPWEEKPKETWRLVYDFLGVEE